MLVFPFLLPVQWLFSPFQEKLFQFLNIIFRPSRQISSTSAKIANGNYGSRIPIQGKDEISSVAHHFNLMAEQIETQIKQLEDASVILPRSRKAAINAHDRMFSIFHINKPFLTVTCIWRTNHVFFRCKCRTSIYPFP
ncbi:MAG: HAMP domain-containing protein [Lachnospiraceae bacterium]